MSGVRASVVVATYDRRASLERLLATLARQTVPRGELEVVVVDDGSREDASPVAVPFRHALDVSVLRQENSGVAVARQRGVERAKGRIIVFIDDDMLVEPDFVEQHLALHEGHDDRVVMGRLLADPRIARMPLFERFHARMLDRMAETFSATGTFAGNEVYTGNLSLPRELFLRVGGFDPAFTIEDAELGVRLEAAGAKFVFTNAAPSVHASDHTSASAWLARSILDGRGFVQLTRKHPTAAGASPWRYLTSAAKVNPGFRPILLGTLAFPRAAQVVSRLLFEGATGVDALGLGDMAVTLTTIVYGMQYYLGVRLETGSLVDVIAAYRAYLRARGR